MRHYLILGAILVSLITSCTKNNDTDDDENTTPEDNISNLDVYISGNGFDRNSNYAMYWKNDSAVSLKITNQGSAAYDIAVKDGDVYVVGILQEGGISNAVYWKNGELFLLSDKHSGASKILIHNDDIYFAGYEVLDDKIFYATYWKNGIAVNIDDPYTYARSIAVKDNNIHVVGYMFKSGSPSISKYWINENNADWIGSTSGTISQMIINSEGTYFLSHITNQNNQTVPQYWKNGSKTELEAGSTAYSFTTKGNDVYTAGSSKSTTGNNRAQYWKNNSLIYLTDGNSQASAHGIGVYENTVYTAGQFSLKPHYWINDKLISLPSDYIEGFANAVAIVEKK